MEFDLCKHKLNLVLIRCGQILYPDEKDVTKLAEMMGERIGILPEKMTGRKDGDHLPTPQETGPFFTCPKCEEKRMTIDGLCPSCTESEGGKFLSKLHCPCGFVEKSKKPQAIQWIEHGYTGPLGMKKGIGMKTITDEGIK